MILSTRKCPRNRLKSGSGTTGGPVFSGYFIRALQQVALGWTILGILVMCRSFLKVCSCAHLKNQHTSHGVEAYERHNPVPLLKHDISADPSSVALLNEIKDWIKHCEHEHPICNDAGQAGNFTPSRLLKLDDGVSLCIPHESVHFAALSYCWGTSKQPTTTKANLQARLGHVDVAELPQTLKDAICICRGLGVNYIWIDSLCIVQDDEEDWVSQSAQMARLYSCARIVIAATTAADANEGFLRQRDLPVTLTTTGSRRGALRWQTRRVRNHHPVIAAHADVRALPLSKRGWTLQEELLATRLLYFCPDEVVYRCKTSVRCECQRDEFEHATATDNADILTIWPPPLRKLYFKFKAHDETGFLFSIRWGKIVGEFSSRRLTYPDDALPALSGIAYYTTMFRPHPGRYIAGMWEHGFIFQLGWINYTSTSPPKPVPSRPTFSWITARNAVWPFDGKGWSDMPYELCALMGHQVVLATADPCGRIVSACVYLCGPAVSGSEFFSEVRGRNTKADRSSLQICIDKIDSPLPGWGQDPSTLFEQRSAVCDWTSILCLGLYGGSINGTDKIIMLLLQPEPGTKDYVRVGLVSNMEADWFSQRARDCHVIVV